MVGAPPGPAPEATHGGALSRILDRFVLPSLGGVKVRALTPEMVEDWHASLDVGTPTYRAHAYSLLRTLMGWAVEKRQATVNPCQIRGAGSVKRRRTVRPATLEELAALVEAMPAKYRPMTLLAAWAALRFGELTELRRRDLDLEHGIVRVRRGVVRVDGQVIVGDPKSQAGARDVAIPPHLVPALAAHLDKMGDAPPGSLSSSPPLMASHTWRRRRSTRRSTEPAMSQEGRTCAGTTSGTPGQC